MKYILESSFLVVAMLLGIACGYATCLWTQDAYRQRPNQTDQTLNDILVATLIGGVAGLAVGLAVDSLVKRIETRRTVAAWMWTSLIAGWIAFTFIDSIVNSPVRE